MKSKNSFKLRGFTLIELLTVIAIIGILAAIIIPTVSSVRTSANKAKTKVQFNQWASAMELFKQEYGYYPDVSDGSHKVSPVKLAGALTGRDLAGTKLTTGSANLAGNKRILSFYSIADTELNEAKDKLVDAFGNTDIVVYIDTTGDGFIKTGAAPTGDGLAATAVTPIDGTAVTPTTGADKQIDTANGIRAGVVFYSAGKGTSASDIVLSWK